MVTTPLSGSYSKVFTVVWELIPRHFPNLTEVLVNYIVCPQKTLVSFDATATCIIMPLVIPHSKRTPCELFKTVGRNTLVHMIWEGRKVHLTS